MNSLRSNCDCVSGGDKGLGEGGGVCGVLLPDRKCGSVQLSFVQSDRRAAQSGTGRHQGHFCPEHFQPHPAAQTVDGTADTESRRLCCLSLGHQGGASRHVRPERKHVFRCVNAVFSYGNLSSSYMKQSRQIGTHTEICQS